MQQFQARSSFAAVDDLLQRQNEGLAGLQASYAAVDVVESPELHTPEVIGTKPGTGFLTGPSTDRAASMRAFLGTYAAAYGLTGADAQALVLVADYENPAGNMARSSSSRINGLPVFRGLLRGGFTARGELARTTGTLATGIDPATLSVAPVLSRQRPWRRRPPAWDGRWRPRPWSRRHAVRTGSSPSTAGGWRATRRRGCCTSRWRPAWHAWHGRPNSGAIPTPS
jgi:hypothetical protein